MISEIFALRLKCRTPGGWMRATEILDQAVERRPEGPALHCGGTILSYAELHARVGRLAAVLAGFGVAPGDRVAILHRNCHRFLETYFAALHRGAALVPINPHLSSFEIRKILEDSEAALVVSDPTPFMNLVPMYKRLPRLTRILWTGPIPPFKDPRFIDYEEAIASAPNPPPVETVREEESMISHLYYTSGSTGIPKGVILTRGNLTAHLESVLPELGIDRETGWGHIAPMYHLADAWAVWAVTAAGGTHAFLPEFRPPHAVSLLESGLVSMTNLVPTMYNRMVREPGLNRRSFPRLRMLLSGGAAISPETALRITSGFRCEYVQTYGLTETSPLLTLSLPGESMRRWPFSEQLRIRCTAGRPMRGVEVKVVGENDVEIPRDGQTVGEIVARGPTVSPGYWKRPEETKAAYRNGYLRTGDLAVVGPEGYLSIVDRKKDLINSGGEKVYSLEVENALHTHSDVMEAAVIGIADPDLGEAVKALVVPVDGKRLDPAALIAHCRERLSYFKVPRSVEILAELPRTGSGKILKRILREKYGV